MNTDIIEYIADMLEHPPMLGQWLKNEQLDVYLRFGAHHRIPPGEVVRCLDIGQIQVLPEFQNTGVFTKFLTSVEQLAASSQFPVIFVENVMTERFGNFLKKRGYTCIPQLPVFEEGPPSYYKLIV